MSKSKIKRNDVVIVTAGAQRGAVGKVLQMIPGEDRVIVEKVNLVKRQVKPVGDRMGGTVEKEAALHISNVALYDAETQRRIKVGWRRLEDGRNVRFDKRTDEVIDKA